MSTIDDVGRIKAKLDAYQAETPGFDELFGDEVPGEARLCHICQSKLAAYQAAAPSYEELMQPVKPVIIPHPGRVFRIWTIGIAATACLAFLFLLPNPISLENQEAMSLLNERPAKKTVHKFGTHPTRSGETFLTKKLNIPASIKRISVSASPKTITAIIPTGESENTDTTVHTDLEKLIPGSYNSLAVVNNLGIEEAYARARATKKHRRNDKLLAGLSLNGGNRLLSFVNTNRGNDPLQASASQYADGLNVLEGSSTMSLRTAEVSKNEWEAPDNIPSTSLANYEATYYLPMNIGLSVSIPLNNMFEIQTGISYTYLYSKTEGMTGTSSFILHRKLHYIGIPLRLAFDFFDFNKFRIYTAFGGSVEKGLVGVQTSKVVTASGDEDVWDDSQKVYGLQPTINGLAGISYEIAHSFLLYFEPGCIYNVPNDQPVSSRTEEPFNFNIGIGLRYRLN